SAEFPAPSSSLGGGAAGFSRAREPSLLAAILSYRLTFIVRSSSKILQQEPESGYAAAVLTGHGSEMESPRSNKAAIKLCRASRNSVTASSGEASVPTGPEISPNSG